MGKLSINYPTLKLMNVVFFYRFKEKHAFSVVTRGNKVREGRLILTCYENETTTTTTAKGQHCTVTTEINWLNMFCIYSRLWQRVKGAKKVKGKNSLV